MRKNIGILFLFSILFIVMLACNLPSAIPTPPPVDIDATQTSLALTETAVVGENQLVIEQPVFTATPMVTLTPTITPTLPPSVPMVSVSVDTNCRAGPGTVYEYLTGLLVGEKAEIIGKYTSTSPVYWIIKKGAITCWLWGKYATVEGDTSNLPEMTPPPTPTPSLTNTPTATPTATTPPPVTGDLHIIEIFMSASPNYEVVIRVGTNPTGSLNGNFQYTIYANTSQVAKGSCPVPTGNNACWTGYKVSGSKSIQAVIDSNNAITESNEGNNAMTVTCNTATSTCN